MFFRWILYFIVMLNRKDHAQSMSKIGQSGSFIFYINLLKFLTKINKHYFLL